MRLAQIAERTDWKQMEQEVTALIERLRQKPEKAGFQCSPGGILNAYREGDITFDEAVDHLSAAKGKIIVTRRSSDYHACLEGNPGIWGCGKNTDAAIGDLIRSHRDTFKIEVKEQ